LIGFFPLLLALFIGTLNMIKEISDLFHALIMFYKF